MGWGWGTWGWGGGGVRGGGVGVGWGWGGDGGGVGWGGGGGMGWGGGVGGHQLKYELNLLLYKVKFNPTHSNLHVMLIMIITLIPGPAPPAPITQYSVVAVSFELALVTWMVPRITYIPETYMARYQEVSDAAIPAQVSAPVNGTTNLTSVDDEYFVVLRNLQPNTQYSFQILSSNTIVTRFTPVMTFLTSTSGMYYNDTGLGDHSYYNPL